MTTLEHAIVVGVDGSEPAGRAVRWAADAARRHGHDLRIVHCLPPREYYGEPHPSPRSAYTTLRNRGKELLAEAAAIARRIAPESIVDGEIAEVETAATLVEYSRRARLVVLGPTGVGALAGALVGSVAVAVTGNAHCPVAVVRGRSDVDGPVVVGVDGGQNCAQAIDAAFREAWLRGTELVAVHAWMDGDFDGLYAATRLYQDWDPISEREEHALAERLAGWRERYPDVPVLLEVRRDRPGQVLREWSERAQLIVVGSRGRGGFGGLLLGSTSQDLIRHADCPVLVVRPIVER